MITIAVIGAGYWGPNLIRNFSQLKDCRVKYICDLDIEKLKTLKKEYPTTETTKDYKVLLGDPEVDAIVIAVPTRAHYSLSKEFLEAGKHVFCEKPLTLDIKEAEELVQLAEKKKRILMVDHILEYHPALKKLNEYSKTGELGSIRYIYSIRVNLGKIRSDENILWSYGVHDIAMILRLLGTFPTRVAAHGACYVSKEREDVVFFTMYFPNNVITNTCVSWLHPIKLHQITVVGDKKMVIFDDTDKDKIKLFDKSVEYNPDIRAYKDFSELLTLKWGDVTIPHIDSTEPMKLECQHFLDCIKEDKKPISDGESAVKVLKILDAATKSLKSGGKVVEVKL